ncbi:MAG: hypothetical protein ACP5MG_01855 [Verrucomicrobiia bacterium]
MSGKIKFLTILLAIAVINLMAGDPIQFSAPRKSVKTPVDDPVENLLNNPLQNFKPGNSLREDMAMPMVAPQPVVIIPKKNGKEEVNDFDPFLKRQDNLRNDFEQSYKEQFGEDRNRKKITGVEQFLLKQEKQSVVNNKRRNDSLNPSDEITNPEYGKNRFNELRNNSSQYEQIYGKNQFDPFTALKRQETLTRRDPFAKLLPGEADLKSIIGNKDDEQAAKLAKEKMDEFRRLLGDAPVNQINGINPKEAINNLPDLTRQNDNPISVSPLDKFGRASKRDIGGTYDDSFKLRNKAGLLEDNRSPFFQNKGMTPQENYSSPEAERERQKPKPLLNPIPKRAF